MSEQIAAGTWVEIYAVLLTSAERAPGLPADTAQRPYESWVKGFLAAPAALGEEATVQTLAGRTVSGKLVALNPAHAHSFGSPHPAMLAIGPDLRRRLAGGGVGA